MGWCLNWACIGNQHCLGWKAGSFPWLTSCNPPPPFFWGCSLNINTQYRGIYTGIGKPGFFIGSLLGNYSWTPQKTKIEKPISEFFFFLLCCFFTVFSQCKCWLPSWQFYTGFLTNVCAFLAKNLKSYGFFWQCKWYIETPIFLFVCFANVNGPYLRLGVIACQTSGLCTHSNMQNLQIQCFFLAHNLGYFENRSFFNRKSNL